MVEWKMFHFPALCKGFLANFIWECEQLSQDRKFSQNVAKYSGHVRVVKSGS